MKTPVQALFTMQLTTGLSPSLVALEKKTLGKDFAVWDISPDLISSGVSVITHKSTFVC